MRMGDTYVLDLGRLSIDFRNLWTDPDMFPMETISNFEEWRRFRNYRAILKPEEDHDLMDNKGQFRLYDSFTIVFLMSYYSDD